MTSINQTFLRNRRQHHRSRKLTLIAVLAVIVGFFAPLAALPATAAGTVGQGFTVTASDLSYILKQIKIAEAHVANTTPATGPCGALVGTGPNQLSSPLLSFGLRTVDGSCNNLVPGKATIGAADELFPRLAPAQFRDAGPVPAGFGPPGSTSYTQTKGNVFDTEPRTISNLIVDQTSTNPAAIAAAGFPVRTQGNEGVFPCVVAPGDVDPVTGLVDVDGRPNNCIPDHETLFIPNVTTDVGLSPPYNSLFTLFGQFFDHGIDQTVKGGSGTVFVPLKDDDPLVAGPNHIFGDADDLDPNLRFMVLSRGTNQPGGDGILGTADDIRDVKNTDSPWVDQSQTYTSHPSHQAFLREYVLNASDQPVSTGKLLGQFSLAADTTDTGMATWASTKEQAATMLGLELTDKDVLNVPMLAVDAYGNFIPGDLRGMPQYVTTGADGVLGDRAPTDANNPQACTSRNVPAGCDESLDDLLVEGDRANPVPVPSDVAYFDTPFLTDIAHNAEPKPGLVPDDDNTASADFASQPAGTYDDEMLDAHFIAGDGRVNENIGLTTIHQVFHSEHDRLVGDVEATLDLPANAALKAAYENVSDTTFDYGERIFQVARFVTEMEYQHLVFEEFARKVQPGINPFEPFAFTQPDLNPAIRAEFAHAVYRFGHSMLTETISRTNADGSNNDISLLDGFLNPPSYYDGGEAGPLNAQEAAGSIIMGMSDQTGNELDEFVTDTLRNNLLGLPLDLPTVNMTRARSEGVPPLNVFRRHLFAATNDGQLTPYTSWVDFGENIKHPESLTNFVAAYGQHPTILTDVGPDGELGGGDDGPATLASRREAARRIVNPLLGEAHVPADAAQFMNSVGAWANEGNHSITGLDDVDLWVGGLAEMTLPFGGLLGSTFNYVFENQLTDLQNGDRLYYLARTPGMNLRTQLEGNSFAEMMMRNTEGTNTLKADPFATADCKFQMAHLAGTAAGFTQFGNTVADDSTTECKENLVLLRQPDGTIQYRASNTVDPPGINGQAVYNGTSGVDRIRGGNDNDTFWGGPGNDIIEGGSGADVALGGEGRDIITDLGGDDVPKGGPGNDAIDAGPGLDIIMGGTGKDFTNGGANANETFGGADDDFIYLGQSLDAAFGDSGDDWEEGGDQPDLMQGDSGNLFFLDDSQTPGHDILVGQGGDDDYDMEGGDDIGVGGSGIEKVAGSSGFDWEIGQGEAQAQDMDLAIPIAPLDILQVGVRDKFNEVEALSGWKFNDTLRGDDLVPAAVGGGGFIGCDALDQAGLDRIKGLDPLIPPLNATSATPLADVVGASASTYCPLLSGAFVWGAGNVLLGGAGNDLIEGRGADDIIDGDAYIGVRLSVRTNPDDPSSEIGSSSIEGSQQSAMTSQYLRTTAGALTGPTLQQAVFAGTVDPGNIVAVREVLNTVTTANDCGASAPAVSVNCDTALFSGPRANYTLAFSQGQVVVTQTGVNVVGQKASDGIDTVRNMERLQFSDQVLELRVPSAPTITSATAGNASATVTWTAPATAGVSAISSYEIVATPTGPGAVITRTGIGSTVRTATITGLTNGTTYTLQVRAVNEIGAGALSAPSSAVTPATVPGTPTGLTAARGNTTVDLTWVAPNDGGSAITGYNVQVRTGTTVVRTISLVTPATSTTVTGLTNGTAYNFRVQAVNALGTGPLSAATAAVTPAAVPDAPTITAATAGNASATVTWTAPAASGGSAITSYQIVATPTGPGAVITRTGIGAAVRTATITGLTNGTTYTLQVRAVNAVGLGALSAPSSAVTPVTVPGTPTAVSATRGNTTADVTWVAPASDGGSAITGYNLQVRIGATVVRTINLLTTATSTTVTGLNNGTAYNFRVQAVNAVGTGPLSAASAAVTPATLPGAPQIGAATSGGAGGAVNATATWAAPATNGGSNITGYRVTALPVGGGPAIDSATLGGNARSLVFVLPAGDYRFTVVAINAVGTSAPSDPSNQVTAR